MEAQLQPPASALAPPQSRTADPSPPLRRRQPIAVRHHAFEISPPGIVQWTAGHGEQAQRLFEVAAVLRLDGQPREPQILGGQALVRSGDDHVSVALGRHLQHQRPHRTGVLVPRESPPPWSVLRIAVERLRAAQHWLPRQGSRSVVGQRPAALRAEGADGRQGQLQHDEMVGVAPAPAVPHEVGDGRCGCVPARLLPAGRHDGHRAAGASRAGSCRRHLWIGHRASPPPTAGRRRRVPDVGGRSYDIPRRNPGTTTGATPGQTASPPGRSSGTSCTRTGSGSTTSADASLSGATLRGWSPWSRGGRGRHATDAACTGCGSDRGPQAPGPSGAETSTMSSARRSWPASRPGWRRSSTPRLPTSEQRRSCGSGPDWPPSTSSWSRRSA